MPPNWHEVSSIDISLISVYRHINRSEIFNEYILSLVVVVVGSAHAQSAVYVLLHVFLLYSRLPTVSLASA